MGVGIMDGMNIKTKEDIFNMVMSVDQTLMLEFLHTYALVNVNNGEPLRHTETKQLLPKELNDYFYKHINKFDESSDYDLPPDYIFKTPNQRFFRLCCDIYRTPLDWCEVKIEDVRVTYRWGIVH